MSLLPMVRLTCLVTVLMAGCGEGGSDPPASSESPTPRIEVRRVSATPMTNEVDSAVDRGATPSATLTARIRSPDRFMVSGWVVPRHNSGMRFSVRVRCFNAIGAAAVQRTIFAGRRDVHESGYIVRLRFGVDDADICSIAAMARPERFRSVRVPRQALARVSLQCPRSCSVVR